ncbi:MAG: SUMF1/EgtB/PvdO family nonheme iron enzyme [Magnetococcales bacterium]|nr:SUMF1/EgtB/PvdO family nonheme iron enzyme [Magnetococcales bacterium]
MARVVNLTVEQAERLIHHFTPGYKVEHLLGDGSFGQVFLIEDAQSRVAVKIVPLTLRSGEGEEENHEWQQLTTNWDRLNHASLVRNRAFFTYDETDPKDPIARYGLIYMDYWSTDLSDCIRRLVKEGRHTPSRKKKLFLGLTRLLQRLLEDTGLIITDLKLENVMVGSCGQGPLSLALIDLGGIFEARLADYYRVVTTDFYMAPELYDTTVTRIDEPILIFSLGLIGYYILEGRWPVADYDYKKPLLLKIRQQGGLNWSAEVQESLPGYVAVIERCLEEKRADRYSCFAEVAEAIKQVETAVRAKNLSQLISSSDRAHLSPPTPQQGQDRVWREPLTGMRYHWIPKGSFVMGQSDRETRLLRKLEDEAYFEKWFARELPRHTVQLDGFWMAETPVTHGHFSQFVEDTLYLTDAERTQYSARNNPGMWDKTNWGNWNNCNFDQDDQHPVIFISWFDAEAYILWLRERTNLDFSLPTEAQWEYACHGGGSGVFHFGANISTDQANYDGELPVFGEGKPGLFRKGTTAVGTFPANGYGLYDMHGNVWEWALDHYNGEFYDSPEARRRNPLYRANIGYCIKRGGSWRSPPAMVRCAYRGGTYPDIGKDDIGLRPVILPTRRE